MVWIDERNYPGGPLAYQLEQQGQKIQIVGNIASVLLTILADLCMVGDITLPIVAPLLI